MDLQLSDEQRAVLNLLWQWLKRHRQGEGFVTMGGYAGTGKTTILGFFRRYLHESLPDWKIAFVSYTGKATRVLSQSLKQTNAVYPEDFIGTFHSLIYSPILSHNQQVTGWQRKPKLPYHLIIIDEASMIDYNLWMDAVSFGVPVIAVGDHGQLPPVEGEFNLMENPILRLETIHRQAAENPIIKLSLDARTKGEIKIGNYGSGVKKLSRSDYETGEFVDNFMKRFSKDDLILCAYNQTRVSLNNAVRIALGFETPEPQVGDRLICLRNNRKKLIYNGMLGTIQHINSENNKSYYVEIDLDGEDKPYTGLIEKKQFGNPQRLFEDGLRYKPDPLTPVPPKTGGVPSHRTHYSDLFDFGYALTVHKAQGSQAKRVLLFEERMKQLDDFKWRRWLYTAVTRAEQELYIIGDDPVSEEI
jgi:exodeoxyribonuclease-5